MKKLATRTDFVTATERYEAWLASCVEVIPKELDYKHAQMALRDDVFPFFRGTYYRWAEVWPQVCPENLSAPKVLGVGDLHIENFGTWRDNEGRLVWGINDFDEADDLPFSNDLVRLAASAAVGADTADLGLNFKKTCRAILTGFVNQLRSGGKPFVLEEDHPEMRSLATQADRDPVIFWKKFLRSLKDADPKDVAKVESVLKTDLQTANGSCQIQFRPHVGMGSLGKPRFAAHANLQGAWVAREAKALTPPATACLDEKHPATSRIPDLLKRAVRCADPFLRVDGAWIVRRLAPRCSRIESDLLTNVEDEKVMFTSMGAETANIHCGTPDACEAILEWINAQDNNWLEKSALAMVDATQDDWKTWRKAYRKSKS